MLEIKLCVDDVDYEALLDCLAPFIGDALKEKGGIAALAGGKQNFLRGMGKLFLKAKGSAGAEEAIVQLAQKKNKLFTKKIEDLATKNGIKLHVQTLDVKHL